MSTGIELIVLLPLLVPGMAATGALSAVSGAIGAAVAAGSAAGGAAVTGGVVVTGSSIATTSAFATGSIAAAGSSAATGAGVATGAAALGGAVVVFGAAAAALLAARHLQVTYQGALREYDARLNDERMEVGRLIAAQEQTGDIARLRVQKAKLEAVESADLTFLRSAVSRLKSKLENWPEIDPTLPRACMQLSQDLEDEAQSRVELFSRYELLCKQTATWAEKRQGARSERSEGALSSGLKLELEAEIRDLKIEISQAPESILEGSVRSELQRLLRQIEHLLTSQPLMARQGLELLSGRVRRELTLGAEREAQRNEFSQRVRELTGRISARSQATIAILEDPELAANPLAFAKINPHKRAALSHLERLSRLLSGELRPDLMPLERLADEADSLYESTADQLRQIALQLYLEEQVREVFTTLGYRVTMSEDPAAGMVAALDSARGVEIRLDGQGNLHSELVSFSTADVEIESNTQDKVCALMDDVIDSLRARGCTIREKKRRHYAKGEKSLKVVETPKKKEEQGYSVAPPQKLQLGE